MLKGFGAVLLFSSLILNTIQTQTIDTLIEFGSHSLHFTITPGSGTPIVFEAGNGDDGSVWLDLLKPIHDSTGATMITYDRAGLGQSSIDTLSVSFWQEVSDLKLALRRLGFEREVFLVSHSFGSFYTTAFAHQNQHRVTGIVLIDPALPCFFTEEWSAQFKRNISTENWALIKQYKPGLYYVLQKLDDIAADMSDKHLSSDIPLTLIAAGQLLEMVQAHEEAQWKECLATFGALPNHRYILAEQAGHQVWKDDPQIVIQEIVRLYRQVH